MTYKGQKQYRLSEYDYGVAGIYFVTICVKDRLPVLSTVGTCRGTFLHDHAFPLNDVQNRQDFELILFPIEEIVKHFWLEIPNRFPVVRLDEWVIMPDHVAWPTSIKEWIRTGWERTAARSHYWHPTIKNKFFVFHHQPF